MSKQKQFIFKTIKDLNFYNRNAFKNETTIRPPAHTHNANAESEEISPYDSQKCLIRIKTKHLILLLVHSVEKIHFENKDINLSRHRHFELCLL